MGDQLIDGIQITSKSAEPGVLVHLIGARRLCQQTSEKCDYEYGYLRLTHCARGSGNIIAGQDFYGYEYEPW